MSYKTIQKSVYNWHWKEFGSGKKLLFAFHGFNRNPDDFHSFGRWLGSEYKILAFDLFFHGRSDLTSPIENKAITYDELKLLIDAILDKYQATSFEVIAYSFGGRLALNCVELYGNAVKGLFLMAPDAMRFNPAYYFFAQTLPGRFLFKWFLKNPAPALRLMQLISDVGFYDKKVMGFFIEHIKYDPMRYKVYNCWMLHRKTVPDLNRVAKIIRESNIKLLLFFGKHDNVIPPKLGVRFAEKCRLPNALHILEIGHRLPEKHEEICKVILGHQKGKS